VIVADFFSSVNLIFREDLRDTATYDCYNIFLCGDGYDYFENDRRTNCSRDFKQTY
jgi:hypothetical protein